MPPAPDTRPWPAVLARIDPRARLAGTWTIDGGLSSTMTVLDAVRPGGAADRLIVRQRRADVRPRPGGVAREFRLVTRLRALGVPVPEPVALDEAGDLLHGAYAVYRYVDGSVRVSTADPVATGRAYAEQLATIHALDPAALAGVGLPDRSAAVHEQLAGAPTGPDASRFEPTVRRALDEHRHRLEGGPRCVLHGDLWPGNVLFAGAGIVAVIDWEHACLGDPLADVAITRLDLWWAYGRESATAFTDAYLARTGADPSSLAVWELVAALRPAGQMSSWAADWVRQGRPDITAAHLRAVHRRYVDGALAALAD